MKTRQLSTLPADLAEELQDGEPIEIRDGEMPVAQVVPLPAPQKTKAELVQEFLALPRPKFSSGSLLEALLEERKSGR